MTVRRSEDIPSHCKDFREESTIRARERTLRRRQRAAWRRLRRRPELATLARLAKARGLRAWVVGGAPRDLLLKKGAADVDVAVARDAEALARELSDRGLGTVVPLSEAAPRVFRVAGPAVVDLSDVEGAGIGEDLARRDFTVNALGVDLATGEWLDPFGGLADLAAGRLRLVREANFREDPLRAFRAARLLATHGLRPDRRTLAACRETAPRLAGVAPERIAVELTKLLEAERAGPAFRFALAAGLLAPALDLPRPRERFASAARRIARLDRTASRLPAGRRRVLRLAALAEGVGLTPPEAAGWLARRRFGRAEAGAAARLMELARLAAAGPRGRGAWAWIHDAGDLAQDALALARLASARSARAAAALRRLHARRAAGPEVTGADVMSWATLPEGRAVGELLREVRIEGLRGRVKTRREARRFVEGRAAGTAAPAPKVAPGIRRRS